MVSSLAPEGGWRVTLERLAREDENATLALVGHEPELGSARRRAAALGGRQRAGVQEGGCVRDRL